MNRSNPFDEVYAKCNNEKFNNLPKFPRYIDIEVTNACNFTCLMCPTGTGAIKRATGFMDFDLYQKIIDQIKETKTPIRFIRWGEPLLHKSIYNFIELAKCNGIMCHMNTNGSLLNDESIDRLLTLQLDSIKFSFQGVDKVSYEEMRCRDFFDDLYETIKLLHKRRGNKIYPFIHVATTITYETDKQVQEFKDKFSNICDLVSVGRTMLSHIDISSVNLSESLKDRLIHLKSKESLCKVRMKCPEVFSKLSIDWDGQVTACCKDYDNKMVIGNLNSSSLNEIWTNKKMNTFRKIIKDMNYEQLELCRSCYDVMDIQKKGVQKT